MKIFKTSNGITSDDPVVYIYLEFPERVDFVALSGFLNDHQITFCFHFEPVDGKVWKAVVTRTNEQVQWAPSIEVLGFQL